jgi:hypothetical protein
MSRRLPKQISAEVTPLEVSMYNPFSNDNCTLILHKNLVRRKRYKLYQKCVNGDLRKYFFASRIDIIWNVLPVNILSCISMLRKSLDQFVYSLDIFKLGSQLNWNWIPK